MSSDLEILESLQEFGTKQFSKVKKSDRNLYGKEFGKDSLTAFAKYIDPKFEDPLHIKSIIHLLEEMEKGKITRTIINMPPRRGKSQICTRIFPTWFLGRHPDKNVILLSYSDKKAARFGRWVRDCVESSKFQHVFPECKVRPDMRSAGEWQTTKEGLVLSAGLKSGFNGEGADLLIVDDPYKNMEEATSEAISEKIIENFMSVGETRLSPTAIILIIHTRWLRNDLTGILLGEDREEIHETV
ncbi:terminase large subunit domain-containing protein [Leptospira interrogans]|uniref:terminase large subunit domain-containing protein n=1 Tax=Leptospira interrogans TaxID=173 RepID=UPI0002B9E1DE|nr:terminase family protein [Leptospira interrogans]MCR8647689.1 Terminase-like domain protein [Leptospira interrogans serovar Bataviae]OAM85447.1 Terminase-like domain protein [Leptospira interrogans serovar Bataviae]QOI36867.1 Terminase-like domain protein [Leptospira interrogans serovar Bataviae]QOI38357.1 Terminase-like domain protein [Leptospira interrogans serovar Bataviae]QYY60462.1 terminase family protein [Leptospira interrogans serovar Bataviae]